MSKLYSDSKLTKLFSELPLHCVILLDDVDAAGVARTYDADAVRIRLVQSSERY
jgi:hypothetical protein